jgi:predicted dehydrogenase
MMNTLDRRAFLSGAAALASSALAQNADAAPVRTAHIGTGNRGSYLLRSVLDIPGFQVAAVCDLKPDRLDKAASMAVRDKPDTATDYRRLLARKDIDAVYIATPCDLHAEMTIAALEAGKHVYCEKPAGINAESIRKLIAAARRAKTVLQFGQQMRSDARLAATIAKVKEGVAGKIIMVKAQRHAGEDLDHDGPSADWFFNAARSGDVIVEMAVHNLDVCNWVIGSRPERAGGFGGALLWKDVPPGRTNMDGYTLSYEYANGVKMSFTQVFFHPNGMPGNGAYFYVYTTEGAVDVSNAMFYPRGRGSKPQELVPKEDAPKGRRSGPDPHIAAFYETIRHGKPNRAPIEVGATAALTAILGRDAIYRKRVMEWKDFGVDL